MFSSRIWLVTTLLLSLVIVLITGITYKHQGKVALTKMPPESIAQWYKPESKRHVWLHNMFKLRREMQAVSTYAASNDIARLKKWSERLETHYLKIADMVPEWANKLDVSAINALQKSVKNNEFKAIPDILDQIATSCDSCHKDFRATTAMLYRAPDFSKIKVSTSDSYVQHMQKLTTTINQIKIASEDNLPDVALESLSVLKADMSALGKTCINCHKLDGKSYPNSDMRETIDSLELSLESGTQKEQGKELGMLAVIGCAQCHGTHRLSYNMKKTLFDGTNWGEAIMH